MSRPWIRIAIVLGLAGVLALAFVAPSAMLSPGELVPAHADLADSCFACHAPFGAAASDRCIRCHALTDIGLRTTRGSPSVRSSTRAIRATLHQELSDPKCSSCHSDHGRRPQGRFEHGLLRPEARAECAAFHAAPKDAFHEQITGACSRCHSPQRWKPSSFDHDAFFLLDREHDTSCATCHSSGDLTRYTCFGCHEHTPANIRAAHEEEGNRNLDDCASCHRSADGEGGERGEGRERGGGRNDEDD